jgi:hypothetical protein
MKRLLLFVLLPGFLSLFPADSAAIIDPCNCSLTLSCEKMRISICPRRDFEYIRTGCGGSTDHIELWVRDAGGYGIGGIPETDYCLFACDDNETFVICYFFVQADSTTSNLPAFKGRTTFANNRISGGGCALNGIYMTVQGQTILGPSCMYPLCLDIELVSPDINGDLTVDLADLSFFGESYNTNEGDSQFNTCCDYNDDGKCDLSDFAFFGQHYTHQCL